jgi:hypothetical protein
MEVGFRSKVSVQLKGGLQQAASINLAAAKCDKQQDIHRSIKIGHIPLFCIAGATLRLKAAHFACNLIDSKGPPLLTSHAS